MAESNAVGVQGSVGAMPAPVDVLVIGGGPAGIAAALALQRQGRSYVLLEARERLGGRMFTDDSLGVPIDVGAHWIHHYGPSNPLAQEAWAARVPLGVPAGGDDVWIRAHGERIEESDYDAARAEVARQEAAMDDLREQHIAECHPSSPLHATHAWSHYCESMLAPADSPQADSTRWFDWAPRAPCTAEKDQSMAAFLSGQADRHEHGATACAGAVAEAAKHLASPAARDVLAAIYTDLEQYDGAPLTRLSAFHGGEQMDVPEANMQVTNGFARLVEHVALSNHLRVHYDTVVTAVHTQLDGVTVHARKLAPDARPRTAHGFSAQPHTAPPQQPTPIEQLAGQDVVYRARYVVLTVPLSVLQRRSIAFTPALPAWKMAAVDAMGWGLMNKVVLQFDYPWWDEADASETEHVAPRADVLNVLARNNATEAPLWVVSMARPLLAARELAQRCGEQGTDRAWEEHMHATRPAVPAPAPGEVGDAAAAAVLASAAASSSKVLAPFAAGKAPLGAAGMGSGSPHVLVSFSSSFSCGVAGDVHSYTSCPFEQRSDADIVGEVMARLRGAYQAGREDKVGRDDELQGACINVSRCAASARVTEFSDVTARAEEGAVAAASFSIPTAYQHEYGSEGQARWSVARDVPARAVPDPVGYLVTRWGLEPFSHGAYASYAPGTGMHTAATIGKPVLVQRGSDGQLAAVGAEDVSADERAAAGGSMAARVLFAGEATLGVHLGCADSAWLSGLREAKRIHHLWAQQEGAQPATTH